MLDKHVKLFRAGVECRDSHVVGHIELTISLPSSSGRASPAKAAAWTRVPQHMHRGALLAKGAGDAIPDAARPTVATTIFPIKSSEYKATSQYRLVVAAGAPPNRHVLPDRH
jgi:hypothetical protein